MTVSMMESKTVCYSIFSIFLFTQNILGTSLAVQWLRLQAPNAGGMGLLPGWGTKISQAAEHGLKK